MVKKGKDGFTGAPLYKVRALTKKTSREKNWTRQQFNWFRAVMIDRNMVVRATQDVLMSDATKMNSVGGTYLEFEFDGGSYHPFVEHMIYDKGIRYGFFIIGFPDQAMFQILTDDNDKPVVTIELPEMDSQTYLHRQQLGFASVIIKASNQIGAIIRNLVMQFYMHLISIGLLGLILLRVFGVI